MKLYLLRHADAGDALDPRLYDDTRRPLSPKGLKRTRQLANGLRQMEISFDAIFTSPYARAEQTAQLMARSSKTKVTVQTTEALLPGSEFKLMLLELIKTAPAAKSVLLVGHKPHLGGFISWLCTGDTSLAIDLKKGGLCRLEVEAESAATRPHATLEWLLSSRHFGPKRAVRAE
jgi:phosphohistidine phosphatase